MIEEYLLHAIVLLGIAIAAPIEAIFDESEIPEEWNKYIPLNYEYFGQEYSG